ncbi:interleukin-2 receptor subunit beta [Osmerus eperlanus]|uniref:interleukin-2 receptor subunit beta n=1 Tax=Osmerus eperlanus TaxID=29151 RepID=UPI002E12C11E
MAVRGNLHLLVVVFLMQIQTGHSQMQDSLKCLNDLINNITCVWNISRHETGTDARYTLFGERITNYSKLRYRFVPCELRPMRSDPALRACSLLLPPNKTFRNAEKYTIGVRLNGSSQDFVVNMTYKLNPNIKMLPPTRPGVENLSISWTIYMGKISEYNCQVQYKNHEDPWESAINVHLPNTQRSLDLDVDRLVMGQRYQARVRVRVPEKKSPYGAWSDWSPTASWESKVGEMPTPSPPPPGFQLVWFSEASGVLVGVVVVIILGLTWLCSTHKPTRLYIVKKLLGPPLPNPSKFFPDLNSAQGEDFKTWLSPKFARESYLDAFLLPVHISPLEVTHTVDTVSPRRPQAGTASPEDKKKKMARDLGSCSTFSNHSYSLNLHLALPANGGALEPCTADSPYGPLVGHREEERGGDAEEESDEEEGEEGDGVEEREPNRGLGKVEDTESSVEGGGDSGVGSWGEDQESRESMGDPDGPAFADAGRGGHFGSNVFQFPSCSSPLPTPLPCFTQIPLTLPGLGMEPVPFTVGPMDLPGKILEDLALMPSSGTIAPSSGGYMAV